MPGTSLRPGRQSRTRGVHLVQPGRLAMSGVLDLMLAAPFWVAASPK
jgi:hypothetical protein